MRLFLTLCALAAVAYAKPQGYNYGVSSGSIGGGIGGSIGNFGGSNYRPSGSFGSATNTFSTLNTGSSNSGYNQFGVQTGQGVQHHQQQHGGFEAPLVHKQFFTISAPEDHDSLDRSKHFVIGRPQKNYRVVFIKAPSSSSANVKLSAEYAPKEEKTVIYVLSKKDSALEVNDIATPAPTVPSKPEVFFIKYKTEDEAAHAQKQIQAEYDKIEGTSEHADGGVGQVQSVIGSLGGGSDFGASATNVHQTGGSIGGFSGVGSSGVGTGGFSGIGSSGVGTGGFSGISTSSIGTGGFSGIGSSISSGSGSTQGSTYLPPSK